MMNKKGRGNAGFYIFGIIFMVLIVGLVIWVGTMVKQQTAVGPPEVQVKEITQAAKKGDASTVKFFAYDQEATTTTTPISCPLYVQDNDGVFVIDGTATGASTRTNANTEIGKTLKFWCVNATYYPELNPYTANGKTTNPMSYEVTGEAPSVDARVYKTATQLQLLAVDDSAFTTSSSDYNLNVTGTASTTSTTISRMKVTNNGTNEAFNLGGFYVDVVTDTNITNVDLVGSAIVTGIAGKPSVAIVDSTLSAAQRQRLGEKDDYIYEIDDDTAKEGLQPLMLHEADYINTGTVSVEWDGDGCKGTGDYFIMYAFDKQCFRSNKDQAVYCNLISNDADSPADIGASDFASVKIGCAP